ncbi:MAG: DUF1835 domain-containing protein [Clostridia bacterium]|nr:DUF1835 domain-containing protein [Clostridia bacterium]
MIDVCFGDSEAGELKMNLLKIQDRITDEDIKSFREAVGKGNNVVDLFFSDETGHYCHSNQICYLNLLFDIGDISGDNVLEKQVDMILDWGHSLNQQEKSELREKLLRRYRRIINAAKKGETIRLWHHDSPHSRCGYYFILSQIQSYHPTVISLYMPDDDAQRYFNHYNRWLDDFKQNFVKAAKVLSQEEIQEAAETWDSLVADHKPLRVDGPNGIMSVDEDYFDDFLVKHIPHGEFRMTELIGAVLGKYKVSDAFIQQRILKMVDEGVLDITGNYDTKSEYFNPEYHCFLRRVMGEGERQALLDYQCKENKMIDIFAGDMDVLRSYLVLTKREKYEDLRFSMTEYAPEGSKRVEIFIPSHKIAKMGREKREELFDKFIDNKYFDALLVDKMLSFDHEICVMDLDLALSDIADDQFYDGRLAYVHNQIVVYLGGEESEAKEIVDNQLQSVEKIIDYAKNGYTLRFWCSHNNEELCSLYYLVNRLRGIDCSILLLDLPKRIRKSNGKFVEKLRRWSQLDLEQIGFGISQCYPHFLSEEEKETYARIWDRLKDENSKIRISTYSGMKSVPIDYYFDLIERNCPKDKPFKLSRLLDLIQKNERHRNLDCFPYYFWATQFDIMIDRGILREVKKGSRGFDRRVEYVGDPREKYKYIERRLDEMGCNPLTLADAVCDDNYEKTYQLLKDNPDISKEAFLSTMGIEEDTFDLSDHNLRIYKYTYCSECGQPVDRMDYTERKYCRYCENPSHETFEVLGEIYERAKVVMNYLLALNVDDDVIKLAIADKNLEKSYQMIKDNENVGAEEFLKSLEV